MNIFLFKIGLFFSILLSLAVGAFLLPVLNKGKPSLHYSIIDKHQMLKKDSDRPRLILLGGSNLSFGIYSPIIQEKFQIDVINLGIHAGYGLKYMVDDYKKYAKENDIVLLIPEYSLYLENGLYGELPLIQGINVIPSNVKLLNFEQLLVILRNLPKLCIKKIGAFVLSKLRTSKGPFVYNRNSFNSCGDAVAHWGMPKSNIGTIDMKKGKMVPSKSIKFIHSFSKFVRDKKGLLLISYPCLNRTSFNSNTSIINQITAELENLNFELIGTPSKYSLPDSLYFDTHYHLSKKGQIQRTGILVNDLEKHGLQQWLNRQ